MVAGKVEYGPPAPVQNGDPGWQKDTVHTVLCVLGNPVTIELASGAVESRKVTASPSGSDAGIRSEHRPLTGQCTIGGIPLRGELLLPCVPTLTFVSTR